MKFYSSKLLKRTDISRNVKRYTFTKPTNFSFEPGQFINIKVSNKAFRSYSIYSLPNDNKLDLVVDLTPMGEGCTYFSRLKVGSSISYIGPFGHLVIEKEERKNKQIVFISSGTGAVPYNSIITNLLDQKYAGKISLIYSEKYLEDFIPFSFGESAINLYKTVTREKYKGYFKGRVTNIINKIDIEPKSLYLICGNRYMIKDVEALLNQKGVDEANIKKEVFY